MLPFLLAILVAAPIVALGAWLYLQRRTLSRSARIALFAVLFLFVLVSGPAIFWMWSHGRLAKDMAATGSSSSKFLGQLQIVWLLGTCGIGTQLYRLFRRKGEL